MMAEQHGGHTRHPISVLHTSEVATEASESVTVDRMSPSKLKNSRLILPHGCFSTINNRHTTQQSTASNNQQCRCNSWPHFWRWIGAGMFSKDDGTSAVELHATSAIQYCTPHSTLDECMPAAVRPPWRRTPVPPRTFVLASGVGPTGCHGRRRD